MTIHLTVTAGGRDFAARLNDSPAARALAGLLPLTLDMADLNRNEKYRTLERPLPADPRAVGTLRAGDLMLYGDDCLVLFYEPLTTTYRYTRLGALTSTEGLREALGSGTVRVSIGPAAEAATQVTLTRDFAAPPERVWAFWTEARYLAAWFGSDPAGTVTAARAQARAGGDFRVNFHNADGTGHTCSGTYLTVDPPRRLESTWWWAGREAAVEHVSVDLTPCDGGTRMTFTHSALDPQTSHDYRRGWASTFDKLARKLARPEQE